MDTLTSHRLRLSAVLHYDKFGLDDTWSWRDVVFEVPESIVTEPYEL